MGQLNEHVVHGALDYGELELLELRPEEILDCSVNANPYGPSPLVRQAIAQAVIDRVLLTARVCKCDGLF